MFVDSLIDFLMDFDCVVDRAAIWSEVKNIDDKQDENHPKHQEHVLYVVWGFIAASKAAQGVALNFGEAASIFLSASCFVRC